MEQKKYLTSPAIGISENLVDGVIKSFKEFLGRPPSLDDLKKFGTPGLLSLASSVEREEKSISQLAGKSEVTVNFVTKNGNLTVIAKESETIRDIAQRNKDLGSLIECVCGGIAACSTCHVIVTNVADFALLDVADEAELDMLDLAYGVTPTSRLGCQLKLKKEIKSIDLQIPDGVNNLF